MTPAKSHAIFWSLMVAAAALRFAGIGFGPYHADEPIVVNHALLYATGDLNPHFFKIPPLMSYLCFGVYGAWFVLGKLVGTFGSTGEFERLFALRPELFYAVGRVFVGVLPGTLAVWAVWRGMRRWAGESAGLWAAAALAFNFLHVRDSHVIYTDIWMTLLIWVSAMAAMDFLKKPGLWEAAWAGAWVGAASAAKYNALLAAAAIGLAWCLASRKIGTAVAAAVAAAGVFLALNPFALLDWRTLMREIAAQAGAEAPSSLSHVLGYSIAESCGWGVLAVVAVGAIFAFKSDRRPAIVFFSFPAVFFLKLLLFSQPHERYVLPLIPFLAGAFGWGAQLFWTAAKRKGSSTILVGAVLASTLLFGLVKAVYADVLFLRADTRDLARTWIEQNVRPGSGVGFTDPRLRPFLKRSRLQWGENPERIGVNRKTRMEYDASDDRGYRLFFIEERPLAGFASVWPAVRPSAEALKAAGVRYVVLHEAAGETPGWRAGLRSEARLVRRVTPYVDPSRTRPLETWSVTYAAYAWRELSSRERFGPVLEIYEL